MQKNRAENFTTVEVDPVNGEHYVIIPEWICDEKQWFEGTEVNIEVEVDGIVITEQEQFIDTLQIMVYDMKVINLSHG